ncbi:hypothetical protein EV356DRAFT_42785 [Viridothelium virens]|uniref:Uncharacterized protein n=1 Tax=Viridothelium virens TaxID=1048519 RepID=A0A6A6HHY1_VIRVR|nr:hypothetical protein EV356DRAFT_42785 [Viridothelium virens]
MFKHDSPNRIKDMTLPFCNGSASSTSTQSRCFSNSSSICANGISMLDENGKMHAIISTYKYHLGPHEQSEEDLEYIAILLGCQKRKFQRVVDRDNYIWVRAERVLRCAMRQHGFKACGIFDTKNGLRLEYSSVAANEAKLPQWFPHQYLVEKPEPIHAELDGFILVNLRI